jgi:hypothetical protein
MAAMVAMVAIKAVQFEIEIEFEFEHRSYRYHRIIAIIAHSLPYPASRQQNPRAVDRAQRVDCA